MEKAEGESLKEKLFLNKKNGWIGKTEDEKKEIFKFSDEYMYYLNNGKTEKEIVEISKDILLKNGFRDISEYNELHAGDKVFFENRQRNLFAVVSTTFSLFLAISLQKIYIELSISAIDGISRAITASYSVSNKSLSFTIIFLWVVFRYLTINFTKSLSLVCW